MRSLRPTSPSSLSPTACTCGSALSSDPRGLRPAQVKLVLKHSKFFVESPYPEVLREILRDPIIQAARVEAPLASQVRC